VDPASLLNVPLVRRTFRTAVDYVDLQWSVIVDQLRRVAPHARGRLLDVGCGSKPYEHIFRPFVSTYVGIEHEATFTQTAASSGAWRADLTYDGKTLPFEDGSFDTVLSVQVLEHTPHPAALVAEMARVLAENGTLILTAPFQFRLHEEPHDYFRYSPHGLRKLCGDAGLEIVEVHPQGSLWTVIGHKLNSYLAFRVARFGSVAQVVGKLGHEAPQDRQARLWTLPFVAPAMFGVALGARVLDRLLFDPSESLGFLVLARHCRSKG
jgi:SAM-dependent methyltransferase